MTDEQIVKALECCIRRDCTGCPLYKSHPENCFTALPENALALIKRQRWEIEKLIDECYSQSVLWHDNFESVYETAKEAIKAEARTEAIREFAERVRSETCDVHPLVLGFVREVVNNIEQEMTEEQI